MVVDELVDYFLPFIYWAPIFRGQFEFRERPQRWRLPQDAPVLRQRAQRLRDGAWERAGERTLEIREKKRLLESLVLMMIIFIMEYNLGIAMS